MRYLGATAIACLLAASGCGPAPAPRASVHERPGPPSPPLPASFGTPDPFTLLAFDPERRWVAMCQAREDTNGDGITRVGFAHHGQTLGDEMKPYFIDGGGEGEPIREFLRADRSGNWVALRRNDPIELLNTRTHTNRDLSKLGLDEERDPEAGAVRTLQFSPASGELLLLKAPLGNKAEAFVLSLDSGNLRTVDFGAGRVWRAGFSDDGRWIYANIIRKDTNGNGTLDLPQVGTTLDSDPCGQPLSYSTYGVVDNQDEIERVVAPVEGGQLRDAKGIQGHLDRDLVRQLDDGTLVREGPNGSRTVLAPASCGGNLDYYSLENGRWLVGCYAPGERPTVDGAPRRPSHLWLFGRGLPESGKDLGIEVENGVEDGHFGTERFSHLATREKTIYFDLQRNEGFTPPAGMRVCAGSGDTLLLETEGQAPESLPDEAAGRRAPTTYLWNPGNAPTPVAEGECSGLSKKHMRIGHVVFSWEKKAIVGDLSALCDNGNCRSLDFEPALDSGYVLLPRKHEPGLDIPGLDKTLRTSIASVHERGVAHIGPLAWNPWAAPSQTASKKALPPKITPAEEPSPSCEILKARVSVRSSAGPPWVKLQEFTALESSFPWQADTEDELPTAHYLSAHACAEDAWAVLESSLLRAARAYEPTKNGEPNWARMPAFIRVRDLVERCEPDRVCAMGLHLMASELTRSANLHATMRKESLELAQHLLLPCHPSKSRDVLLGENVKPSLQVEWLVGGEGKAVRTAQNVEKALRATFEKEGPYPGQTAIGQIAQDDRPDVVQMLLRFREHATASMFIGKESRRGELQLSKEPDPRHEFDMSLGSAKAPRLRALFVKRCRAMGTTKDPLGGEPMQRDSRCGGSQERGTPPQYYHLNTSRIPETRALGSYTASLAPEERQRCEEAFGGKCPEIGLVNVPHAEGTWEALYSMALDLAGASRDQSPLGGMLLDTPLRKEHGKITGALRAWGEGHLYESTMTDLTKVSYGWPGATKADGTVLALRGFIGWLNGVAEARGDPRRFAWVEGYPKGVVIVRPEDLCKLTRASVLRATVSPTEGVRWL